MAIDEELPEPDQEPELEPETAPERDTAETPPPTVRLTLLDFLLIYLVYPVWSWVLRSPLHDLASRSTVLVIIPGGRPGSHWAVPARYVQDVGRLTVVSPRRRHWWQRLRGGVAVRLFLRGTERSGYGIAVESPDEVARVLDRLANVTAEPQAKVPKAAEPTAEDSSAEESTADISPRRSRRSLRRTVAVHIQLGPVMGEPVRASGLAFWLHWVGVVGVGTFVGFAIPVVFWLSGPGRPDSVVQTSALVAVGAAGGFVLGLFQAYVLRTMWSTMAAGEWVRATGVGVGVMWLAGVLAIILTGGTGPSPTGLVRLGDGGWITAGNVGLAAVILLAVGVAQWRILRGRVRRAMAWLVGNLLAWTAGLVIVRIFTAALWSDRHDAAVLTTAVSAMTTPAGLFGALVASVVVAAVTGTVLVVLDRQ